MKKNLISVIILALVLADLILTAVVAFVLIPQNKKSNELIEKVCNAIDLDLEGGGYAAQELDVPLDKIVNYSLNGGETMTINLTPAADGVEHFALVQVTLGLNSEHEDYKKLGSEEQLADKEGQLRDIVFSVVGQHTSEEIRNNRDEIRTEILKKIADEVYGSRLVVTVSFTATVQ